MRAHANCLENLPIYIVVVIALLVTETESPWLDGLAIILLIARIAQSVLHIGPTQTELVAGGGEGGACLCGNEKPVVRSPERHILGALIASKILILKMQQDKNPEVQRSLGLDEKICGQRTCDTRNRCSTSFGDENSFQGYCPAHRDNSNSDFDYFG